MISPIDRILDLMPWLFLSVPCISDFHFKQFYGKPPHQKLNGRSQFRSKSTVVCNFIKKYAFLQNLKLLLIYNESSFKQLYFKHLNCSVHIQAWNNEFLNNNKKNWPLWRTIMHGRIVFECVLCSGITHKSCFISIRAIALYNTTMSTYVNHSSNRGWKMFW